MNGKDLVMPSIEELMSELADTRKELADVQAENWQLKAKLNGAVNPTWSERATAVVTYLASNKAALTATAALALGAWHIAFPSNPTPAPEKVIVREIVKDAPPIEPKGSVKPRE